MPFKENCLKKLTLDRMRVRVLSTLGPVGGGGKIDKKAMRALFSAAGYRCERLRGLELYLPEGTGDSERQQLFVLDNDIPMYDSTVADVVMRKEPTLKEMISIKNALRILNDSDVVVSRKEKSVDVVYAQGVDRLDLTYTPEEIKQLEYEGRGAVEWKDSETVIEVLSLFGELLGFVPEPLALGVEHVHIRGRLSCPMGEGEVFGPAVIYDRRDDTLRWLADAVALANKGAVDRFLARAGGDGAPDMEGTSVIKFLAEEVMRM